MKRVKSIFIATTFLITLNSQAVEVDCNEAAVGSPVSSLSNDVSKITYSPVVSSCFMDSDYFRTSTRMYSEGPSFKSLGLMSTIHIGEMEMSGEFENQKAICDCVNSIDNYDEYQTNRLFFKGGKDTVSNSEAYALAHLQRVIDSFSNRSRYTYDMMILHAQSMDPDMAVTYGVDKALASNQDFKENVNKVIKENVKVGGIVYKEDEGSLDAKIEKIITQSSQAIPETGIVNVLSDNHLVELEGQSCVPMKDFLLFNSFPKSNQFWTSFSSSFNKDDWDISLLKEKFKESSSSNEQEVYASKIEFLEKNPFVKLALNSGDHKVSSKVFGVMKKYMSDSIPLDKCSQKFKGCQNEFKGIVSVYNEEMSKIFKDPQVQSVIKEARSKDLRGIVDDLTADSRKQLDINTLNLWSQEEFGIDLGSCKTAFNMRSPLSKLSSFKSSSLSFSANQMENEVGMKIGYTPAPSQMYADRCLQEVPKYCKMVGNGVNSLLDKGRLQDWSASSRPKKSLDNLYDEIADSMNPDPQKNDSYASFSREQCENHFRKHDNKSLNFVEYEQEVCSKSSKGDLCNNKDHLYLEFLKGTEDIERNKSYLTDGSSMVDYYKNRPVISTLSGELKNRFKHSGNPFFEKADQPKLNDISIAGKETHQTDMSQSSEVSESLGSSYISDHSKNNTIQHDYTLALNNAQEAKGEIEAEIRSTKESIQYNKERLARENTTPEFKTEIEQRVKMLESLLQEKEKSAQDYQNIITKLLDNKENGPARDAAKSIAQSKIADDQADQEIVKNSVVSNRPVIGAQKMNEGYEDSSRSPASISENFSTSGGVKGGAAALAGNGVNSSFSAGATGNRGRATINSALLSKYGITVQESDSTIQVAPDKERSQVSQLLSNATKSDLGLEVSKTEYDKFKSYDLGALNQLYQEKIEMLDTDVVKLMIHTEGEKESLEFYAIKEAGKVVFQPVRKTKLSDLQNALAN